MLNRIAIIDDSSEDRELYKQYLGKLSDQLTFVEFSQGQEALKGLDQDSIQCILLDYYLPDMTALDLLSQYDASRIPIILVTGRGSEDIAVNAFKLGVSDYMIKSSITEESLRESVKKAIDKYTSKKTIESENSHILFLASHDSLTQLYNRKYLEDYSLKLIAKCKRHHQNFALLYIDLDKLKHINDTLGHHVGDKLLIEFSGRMLRDFREDDVICRIGGDEFIVLMENVTDFSRIAKVAQKILKTTSRTFLIENIEINISASIGIYYYENIEDSSFENILKKADKALHAVKESGKNDFQFFSEELEATYQRKSYLEQSIEKAIKNNLLQVFFQPQYNIKTKEIFGLEALLRWFDPRYGNISSTEIISTAEEAGTIFDLGIWTIKKIFSMLNNNEMPDSCTVSINLSAFQLKNSKFIPSVKKIFQKNMSLLKRIEFEVTESCLIHGDDSILQSLKNIKSLGCKLAVGDFAMADSSLYRLSQIDFSTLKVGKSYAKNLSQNKNNEKFLLFVKLLGDTLGTQIIYKGIENLEDEAILEKINLSLGQGYYFHKPAPIDEIGHLF